jgi:hypothetical protein
LLLRTGKATSPSINLLHGAHEYFFKEYFTSFDLLNRKHGVDYERLYSIFQLQTRKRGSVSRHHKENPLSIVTDLKQFDGFPSERGRSSQVSLKLLHNQRGLNDLSRREEPNNLTARKPGIL